MPVVSLDLGDLYKKVFGKEVNFDPKLDEVLGEYPDTRINTGAAGSKYYADDLTLGVEYFMPVTFLYPNTTTEGDQVGAGGESAEGGLISWDLPFPLISITARKILIETHLTERRGTVKELISTGDYDITIRGFLIAETNDYPENLVTTLRNLFEANAAVKIKCPLTDIFLKRPERNGSDDVVITRLNLPGLKGVKNVVPYELDLVSDEPFNLIDIS